jgi:site-specific recombinase XerD
VDDRTRYEAVKHRLRAMGEGTAQQVRNSMEPTPYSVREVENTLDEMALAEQDEFQKVGEMYRWNSLKDAEITREMIRSFKEARLEQQRSPATINRDLSCLRQILAIPVKDELILKSPFFGGRVEFLHEQGRERTLSFGRGAKKT